MCSPLSSLVLLSFSHFSLWVLGFEFLFWVRRFGVSFPSPLFLRHLGAAYRKSSLVTLIVIQVRVGPGQLGMGFGAERLPPDPLEIVIESESSQVIF